MISDGDEALGDLANVVLHESLHATLYVKGQTRLNESLASFVGDELTKHYLDERVGPFSAEKTAYMRELERSEVRTRALHAAYVHLNRLYASPAPEAEKRAEKDAVLARLKADIGARRPINNASLVQFRVYNSGTPELRALLATCGGSWPRFLGALRARAPQILHAPREHRRGGRAVDPGRLQVALRAALCAASSARCAASCAVCSELYLMCRELRCVPRALPDVPRAERCAVRCAPCAVSCAPRCVSRAALRSALRLWRGARRRDTTQSVDGSRPALLHFYASTVQRRASSCSRMNIFMSR